MGSDDKKAPEAKALARAPWWREALLPRLCGRAAVWAATPLGLLSGCWDLDMRPDEAALAAQRNEYRTPRDEYQTQVAALALQRSAGWNAGDPDEAVTLRDASDVDVAGGEGWREALTSLAERLRPLEPRLQPWYVPALFQSLQVEPSELLRESIQPLHSVEMDQDFARGLALRGVFEQAGFPSDTAIVVDAPGPRAVAVAAALADRFDPVFAFGNWPHPRGVVPAHETLAASLYYLPLFEWADGFRPPLAPPVWVLDANRLTPYRDAGGLFDNRYVVKLPSAAELSALGIKHVLYVGSGDRELDDLNAAFVELCARGVEVRMVTLDDFVRSQPEEGVEEGGEETAEEGGEETAPDWLFALWMSGNGWWYGGDPFWQSCFWEHYGWYNPGRAVAVGPPHARRGVTVGPPAVARPTSRSAAWVPAARATHFSPGGHAAFGHVAVSASRATGAWLSIAGPGGVAAGPARSAGSARFGRSGSLGRMGGGGFGG